MNDATTSLLLPAGYGLLAGLRSVSAPAVVARALPARSRGWARGLARPGARRVLGLLALAELAAD
jgi:hypothetical protein